MRMRDARRSTCIAISIRTQLLYRWGCIDITGLRWENAQMFQDGGDTARHLLIFLLIFSNFIHYSLWNNVYTSQELFFLGIDLSANLDWGSTYLTA